MIDTADSKTRPISHGYPLPRVLLAVGIAVVVHGALVGASVMSASGKPPETPAANVKPGPADVKAKSSADAAGPATTPEDKAPATTEKLSVDGPADQKHTSTESEPKKTPDKSSDSLDELKLDSK